MSLLCHLYDLVLLTSNRVTCNTGNFLSILGFLVLFALELEMTTGQMDRPVEPAALHAAAKKYYLLHRTHWQYYGGRPAASSSSITSTG